MPTGCENALRELVERGRREGERDCSAHGAGRAGHMGKTATKQAFSRTFLVHPGVLCTSADLPEEGQRLRGQESCDTREEEGTADRDLTARSRGHYLIIQVLSLFSPENMVF